VIRKIIASGRPGVSRGALNAALSLEIPHGGCTSVTGILNNIPLPPKYNLREIAATGSAKCVRMNVRESDATLILVFASDMPDDAVTARKIAEKHHQPCITVDLDAVGTFQAAQTIHEWLKTHDVHILHVVGATGGADTKKADKTTQGVLEAAYYLGLIESDIAAAPAIGHVVELHDAGPPASIDGVVSLLAVEMPLKDKVILAHMKEKDLGSVRTTLGRHILLRLEKWHQSQTPSALFEELDKEAATMEDAAFAIIRRLWKTLSQTHKLRIVD
jgi:hypothetical protein